MCIEEKKEVRRMGESWTICPICGKEIRGSYYPRTGVNTAIMNLNQHMLVKHKKQYENGELRDITIDDVINMEYRFSNGIGDKMVRARAFCYVCGEKIVDMRLDKEDVKNIIIDETKLNLDFGYDGSKMVLQDWGRGITVDIRQYFLQKTIEMIYDHFKEKHPDFYDFVYTHL